MNNTIYFKTLKDAEHRSNISNALEEISMTVAKTYGPNGSTVFIDRGPFPPLVTKDGMQVVNALNLKGSKAPILNLLKSITRKVAAETGDGTTTTSILADYLYYTMSWSSTSGLSKRFIISTFTKFIDNMLEFIKEHSKEIKTGRDVANILKVSCNSDQEMVDTILKAINVVENDEPIDKLRLLNTSIEVKQSSNGKEMVEFIRGSRYDTGLFTNEFANDKFKTKSDLKNPLVLLSKEKIFNMQQLLVYVERAHSVNRPIVIFCPEINRDCLSTLVQNHLIGRVQVAVINLPGYTDVSKEEYIEDLSKLTGAKIAVMDGPYALENGNVSILGDLAEQITSDLVKTTITSKVSEKEMSEYVAKLENEKLAYADSTVRTDRFNRRINRLKNGISNIFINSDSEVEMFERKDRFDDAIGSMKSSLISGYIAGGGVALMVAAYNALKVMGSKKDITPAENKLLNDLFKAFTQPRFLLSVEVCEKEKLSDVKDKFDADLLVKFTASDPVKLIKEASFEEILSLDVNGEPKTINYYDAGIIDSSLVVTRAVEYAYSLAKTLFTSSSSIIIDEEAMSNGISK